MSQVSKPDAGKPSRSARDGAPPWRLARREFLKIVGVGTAAAAGAVAACKIPGVSTGLQVASDELGPEPGPESFAVGMCGLCPGGCGVLARKIADRVVKLEGNPLHPVNRGRLCPVGQAAPQLLYNPDRLRAPVRRIGERGSGKWQEISWDEAMKLVRSNLADLRSGAGPHTLAVFSGGKSEVAERLMRRFLDAYGSPNFILQPGLGTYSGQDLTQGIGGRAAYDLENADYILSFGAPLVEGWMSPVRDMRAFAQLHRGRPGRRGKLVQIDSRLSATAAKADEWIAVRPGGEGPLALGLAHVLVAQNLYDTSFVEKYVSGFNRSIREKEQGFRAMVLADYPPERVSEMTGVAPEAIRRIAREFARFRPSIALPADPPCPTRESALSVTAVHALNALIGNIDQPGGVLVREDPPLSSWSAIRQDQIAARGVREASLASLSPERFAAAVLAGKPYAVNTLFVVGVNPVFEAWTGFREAAAKIPFVVGFAPFLDETAAQTDLVLPDCTPLERWDVQTGVPGFALMAVGVASPAIPPLYQSRPAAQVILELARALGGDIAASFPWPGPMEAVKELVAGLYASKHGAIFAEKFKDEYLAPRLRGWQWPAQNIPSFEQFWNDLVARGGWVDPRYLYGNYQRTLNTRSRKFELSPLLAAGAVYFESERGEQARKYPFRLHIFKPLALINDASANLPFLQEITGSPERTPWDSQVEMNPEMARRLDIGEGDSIFVESSVGRLKARAHLFAGALPGVVNVPLGQGHTALGRWAKDKGVNPLSLVSTEGPTRVLIERA